VSPSREQRLRQDLLRELMKAEIRDIFAGRQKGGKRQHKATEFLCAGSVEQNAEQDVEQTWMPAVVVLLRWMSHPYRNQFVPRIALVTVGLLAFVVNA
jgi:hypothetical protein